MTQQHDLPVAYLRDLVELVKRWHVTPEALLAKLPIAPADLANPAARVSLPIAGELVARALRMTGEPGLAIYLGMQMRLSSHGFLGFAAMTAATVGDAIALAVRFAATRTDILALAHDTLGDETMLAIEERAPLGPFREFVVIALVVGLYQIAEQLTGVRPFPGRLECSFAAPPYLAQLPLAERVTFNHPVDRLIMPASVLALPLVGADPIAAQLARTECERELAAIAHAGLEGRVRAVVVDALAQTQVPKLPEVAKLLHLSPRTLKRHLAECGTAFTTILADVRRQRALLLLANRELSIGEVSQRLGYTELPNFTRAFRAWTGVTPAAYRARLASSR